MKLVNILALVATLASFCQNGTAQNQEQNELESRIEVLYGDKEIAKSNTRATLKRQVVAINKRQEKGEISLEEAEALKLEAATLQAKNLENQLAILENKIELLQRNGTINPGYGTKIELDWGSASDSDGTRIFGIRVDDNRPPNKVYDKRTTSDLVVGFGLNNAIIDGQGLDDSPYKIGGSRFFELGLAWKTRVFDNAGWLRFKYGISFQFNGLKPKDNLYFVDNGTTTDLEAFPLNLDKSKLRMDNLVIPLHFEIGPSKKTVGDDYVRYSTKNKFKLGLGGYAGVNLSTRQKLKFDREGEDIKEKLKSSYNTNNFIYGLSAYVSMGHVALYAKYDLNTIFKDNPIEQRNVSLGVRFDMD